MKNAYYVNEHKIHFNNMCMTFRHEWKTLKLIFDDTESRVYSIPEFHVGFNERWAVITDYNVRIAVRFISAYK